VSDDAREAFVASFEVAAPDGPAWLQALRKEAISAFAAEGFPTPRSEAWRYTNLAPIARTAWTTAPATAVALDRAAIERLSFPVFACSVFVFVNGRFEPALSTPRALAGGLEVGSLAAASIERPALVEPYLGRLARSEGAPVAALNTALFADGAFVHLPANTVVDAPIHIVHLALPGGGPTASHPRTLVVAEHGSRATVIEDFVSLGEARMLTNSVTEVFLGDAASIEHVSLQREGADAAHLAALRVRQSRDSRYTGHGISLGGTLTRNEIVAVLDGIGAECELNGFYVASGKEHVDNHTTIDHASPHGTSRETYKGVLDGEARGVFSGRVIVRPDAQKTSAQQTNKNLLLSRDAEVDSRPQLEILADDVKCSHGSTIGQLDEDALFYLRSRGIESVAAQALLMRAFATEITGRISIAPLRERIDELLLARLARARAEAA
jgi:Fe-S cluster assembly protein SufD